MQEQIVKIFFLLAIFLMLPQFALADYKLQQGDLHYLGAFRLPRGMHSGSGESDFEDASGAIAFNPNPTSGDPNGSLFIVGRDHEQLVSEISIPTAVNSNNISSLPTATLLQNPTDISQGNLANIGAGGSAVSVPGPIESGATGIGGLLVYDTGLGIKKLMATSVNGYDGDYLSVRSHFTANLNWNGGSAVGFSGIYQVGATPIPVPQAGFLDGYIGAVPNSWQDSFGGSVISGETGLSVINRTSRGPAAFAFDPTSLGNGTIGSESNPASVFALAYYPPYHPALGDYGSNNTLYFNEATRIHGVVFPAGSESVLFFGETGLGADRQGTGCYGEGTSDQNQAKNNIQMEAFWAANPVATSYACGTDDPIPRPTGKDKDGNLINVKQCCYDPAFGGTGDHAYPYVYYAWVYDANDLALAKSGTYVATAADEAAGRFVSELPTPGSTLAAGQTVYPWNVKPYGTWTLTFPIMPTATDITGGSSTAVAGDYKITGAAYDSKTQRLFLTQYDGDANGEDFPLVQVFQLQNLLENSDTTPPAAPTSLGVK